MAEYTANAIQLVDAGENVQFTDVPVRPTGCIIHRAGSGIFRLRGFGGSCWARFRVSFGANVAIPEGGTVEAISVAINLDGEALDSATAIYTPATVDEYGNIYISAYVTVPRECCAVVSIENTGDEAINIQSANLTITREEA